MTAVSADERELAAFRNWEAWGKCFGWELYGCTGDRTATFQRPGGGMFTIGRHFRNDIDARKPAAPPQDALDVARGIVEKHNIIGYYTRYGTDALQADIAAALTAERAAWAYREAALKRKLEDAEDRALRRLDRIEELEAHIEALEKEHGR